MRKCEKFSPYMRKPLVIYDFASDLSEFPEKRNKNFNLFLSVYHVSAFSLSKYVMTILALSSITNFSMGNCKDSQCEGGEAVNQHHFLTLEISGWFSAVSG